MSINPVSFKGVYKVTLPHVDSAKNEKEKAAYTEMAINTIVMGMNASVAEPKADEKSGSIYFKINDANDVKFEKGFAGLLKNCNDQFKVDMAKKAYIEKVSDAEYNSIKSSI
ncbi:hypothetical protein IJD34_00675 [bacterium]|nr:hypothetical protein [bacterium]